MTQIARFGETPHPSRGAGERAWAQRRHDSEGSSEVECCSHV